MSDIIEDFKRISIESIPGNVKRRIDMVVWMIPYEIMWTMNYFNKFCSIEEVSERVFIRLCRELNLSIQQKNLAKKYFISRCNMLSQLMYEYDQMLKWEVENKDDDSSDSDFSDNDMDSVA